jgi:1-deoxy-D-xylulose-5-phosphate synthase
VNNYKPNVKMLGIPDRIVEHGKPSELHRECGYDKQAVVETVLELLDKNVEPKSQFIQQANLVSN